MTRERDDRRPYAGASKTPGAFLAAIFVANLVVMGGGAWIAYENEPEIPDTTVGPEGDPVATSDDD